MTLAVLAAFSVFLTLLMVPKPEARTIEVSGSVPISASDTLMQESENSDEDTTDHVENSQTDDTAKPNHHPRQHSAKRNRMSNNHGSDGDAVDSTSQPQVSSETASERTNLEPGTTEVNNSTGDANSGAVPSATSSEQTSEVSGQCPKCVSKEQEKQLRVEMVKQHLLNMLHLSEPPKINRTLPPLPFDFYLGEDFSVNDDDEEEVAVLEQPEPRQIFVFGDDVTHRCRKQRSSGCYSFNLTNTNIDPDDVESVYLWIYKQADPNDRKIQTFMVSELDEDTNEDGQTTLRIRNIVKRIETALKYGWMKIFVRRMVTRWLSKPQRNQGLSVVCKTCLRRSHKAIFAEKEGLRPILVFTMNQNRRQRRRVRRQTDCEGGNCCRKEELEINFSDIGWNYIMMPQTIRPDFCTGSCNGIQAAYYNHTKMLKRLENSAHNIHGSQIQPCCSPVAWKRPQSLIYRDHQDVVRKVDIPDLIVKSCGCT